MSKQPILRSRYHLSSLAIIILTAILGIAVYKVAIWYRQQAAVVEIHSYRVLPNILMKLSRVQYQSNPESLRSEPSGRHPGAQVPNIAEEAPLAVHKIRIAFRCPLMVNLIRNIPCKFINIP